MSRRLLLGWGLLAAAACRPVGSGGPAEPPDVDQATAEPQGQGPSLEQIADEIDPGPRAAITVGMPAWLADALGVARMSGDPQTLLAEARAELARFEELSQSSGNDAGLPGVIALARALALAERAAGNVEEAPVSVLLVLEQAYRMIDVPMLAGDRNVFSQMLAAFARAMAQQGKAQDTADLEELAELVQGALRRAGDLHRRTVAALLRAAPEHPAVPDVLGRLGPRLLDQDEALAVGVMQRAMSMRGDTATAAHWLDLAMVCHRALDVACGREALARAEAVASTADEGIAERLRRGRTMAKDAHRAVELQDAAGLDDGLERGRALAALRRYDEAQALYEQLMRRHPDDARPVVGLAKMMLMDGLDFVGAGELLDRAEPREHLDRDWYELTIGVRATMLIYHVLPQIADRQPAQIFAAVRPTLVRMREDIGALEALGADEGRVLRFVYDLGMEAWLQSQAGGLESLWPLARGLLPRTRALQAEVPHSLHAYTLMLTAAEFSDDREAALAVLDVEPPAEHAAVLAVRRALGALDLVALWDATERVPDMLRLLDAIDGEGQDRAVRRAVIDGHVLARRLGHPGADWASLEVRYRALLTEPGADGDPVLLDNLAVVVAAQGKTADAQALWQRAAEAAEEEVDDLPRLNLEVAHLAGSSPDIAAVRGVLEQLTEHGGPAEVRLLAHAWLVATARGGGGAAQGGPGPARGCGQGGRQQRAAAQPARPRWCGPAEHLQRGPGLCLQRGHAARARHERDPLAGHAQPGADPRSAGTLIEQSGRSPLADPRSWRVGSLLSTLGSRARLVSEP